MVALKMIGRNKNGNRAVKIMSTETFKSGAAVFLW
jgi:hypothetical protein